MFFQPSDYKICRLSGLWLYLHTVLNSSLELFYILLHPVSCLAVAYVQFVHHLSQSLPDRLVWSAWYIPYLVV